MGSCRSVKAETFLCSFLHQVHSQHQISTNTDLLKKNAESFQEDRFSPYVLSVVHFALEDKHCQLTVCIDFP